MIINIVGFLAITVLAYWLCQDFSSRRNLKKRMDEPKNSPAVALLREETARDTPLKRLVHWLSPYGKLTAKEGEETKFQTMLIHAGFRNPSAVTIFYGLKAFVALVFPLPVLMFFTIRGNLTLLHIVLAFLMGAIGYSLPQFMLHRIVQRRQEKIDRALPDVIDLLIICMEAGLALQATINRVADEVKGVCREVYEELQITGGEMRTGISRDLALKNLGKRTGVQSLQSLVTLMVQSEKLGTSLTQSLRSHADFSRMQRTLGAEEMAAKLPVKIVIPLIFFILPAMFIVIVGPGVIQMARTLIPLLFGQK